MWWQEQAFRAQVHDLEPYLPPIYDVAPERPSVELGGRVEVTVKQDPGDRVVPVFEGAALRLLANKGGVLTFLARRPGKHRGFIVVISPETLLVSRRRFTIDVIEPPPSQDAEDDSGGS